MAQIIYSTVNAPFGLTGVDHESLSGDTLVTVDSLLSMFTDTTLSNRGPCPPIFWVSC
jgi:hypothetical protein